MPAIDEREYTELRREDIATFATSPRAVAGYESLQRAAFADNPADAASAAEAAAVADQKAADAAAAAEAAQTTADGKIDQATADGRYVRQDVGPAFAAMTGTAARTALATLSGYSVSDPPTKAEVDVLAQYVVDLSQRVKALLDDLKANGVLP